MLSKSRILLSLAVVGFLSLPSVLMAQKAVAPATPPAVDPPAACQTAGNLVQNCGFESGDFTNWTATDPTGNTFVANSGFDGLTANSGLFFAALGAVGADGTVSQTLNTTAGQTYSVTYFLANDGRLPNDFSVEFGSTLLTSVSGLGAFGMTPFTFDVTATSNSTTLTFFERNDPGFLGLDDVSVMATPEPGSLALLSFGLASGLLGWRKKIRK